MYFILYITYLLLNYASILQHSIAYIAKLCTNTPLVFKTLLFAKNNVHMWRRSNYNCMDALPNIANGFYCCRSFLL